MIVMRSARRKNRWLAEISVDLAHALKLSADHVRVHMSSKRCGHRKLLRRTARIIVDFPHLGTSTFRSECRLSRSKCVASHILVLSLSASVIFLLSVGAVVLLSCTVHSTPSGARVWLTILCMIYFFCSSYWCTDDLTQKNWKVNLVYFFVNLSSRFGHHLNISLSDEIDTVSFILILSACCEFLKSAANLCLSRVSVSHFIFRQDIFS